MRTKSFVYLAAHVGQIHLLVLLDILRHLVDGIRHLLRRRSTIRNVKLDSEVIIRSTGVVRCSKQDTAVRLPRTNNGGNSWGGDDGIFTNDDVLDPVCCGDTEDDLARFGRLALSAVSD